MKNERERRTLPSASAARTVLGDLMPCSLAVELPPRRQPRGQSARFLRRSSPTREASLAPHLPNALIDEALVIACKISEPNSRATGVVSLAPAQSVNPRARHQSRVRGRLMLSPSMHRIGASIFRLAFEVTLVPIEPLENRGPLHFRLRRHSLSCKENRCGHTEVANASLPLVVALRNPQSFSTAHSFERGQVTK